MRQCIRVNFQNREEQMRAAVQAFHAQHPEVWTLFVKFTTEKISAGFRAYSADSVMHRVRWESDEGRHHEKHGGFKINNNHVAFYARRFMRIFPSHKDFFRTREQTSAERRPAEEGRVGDA